MSSNATKCHLEQLYHKIPPHSLVWISKKRGLLSYKEDNLIISAVLYVWDKCRHKAQARAAAEGCPAAWRPESCLHLHTHSTPLGQGGRLLLHLSTSPSSKPSDTWCRRIEGKPPALPPWCGGQFPSFQLPASPPPLPQGRKAVRSALLLTQRWMERRASELAGGRPLCSPGPHTC